MHVMRRVVSHLIAPGRHWYAGIPQSISVLSALVGTRLYLGTWAAHEPDTLPQQASAGKMLAKSRAVARSSIEVPQSVCSRLMDLKCTVKRRKPGSA